MDKYEVPNTDKLDYADCAGCTAEIRVAKVTKNIIIGDYMLPKFDEDDDAGVHMVKEWDCYCARCFDNVLKRMDNIDDKYRGSWKMRYAELPIAHKFAVILNSDTKNPNSWIVINTEPDVPFDMHDLIDFSVSNPFLEEET